MSVDALTTKPASVLPRSAPATRPLPSAAPETLRNRLRRTLQSLDDGAPAAAWLYTLIDAALDILPLPGSGETLLRWQCLAEVAAFDLSLAKLYEGHTDALAILDELGCGDQHARGRAWGVWAAEAPQARTLIAARADGTHALQQRKAWCSGADVLTHGLATAWHGDGRGPQLVCIDMQQQGAGEAIHVDRSNWRAVGMAHSGSFDLTFDDVPVDVVGGVGDYLTRPGFWHGGAGLAACWYGAAQSLADELRRAATAASETQRPEHALRCVALGKIDLGLTRCAALLRDTAARIDAHPLADARVPALRVRLAAERCAVQVLDEAGRALGAGPLCRDRSIARRFADMPVFIRQCHGERDFLALGTAIAQQSFERSAAAAAGEPSRNAVTGSASKPKEESPWLL
ncbi:MAG: acyl-CoA dehydrogenase [Rubrivivax sp.]